MPAATFATLWFILALQPASPPPTPAPIPPPPGLEYWPPSQCAAQLAYETALNAVPTRGNLQKTHELLASEPHVAGTDADLRTAQRIADAFRDMGLEVEEQEIWVYLCHPTAAALEVVTPERIPLILQEQPLAEDPYSAHPDLTHGWNAYSGSGDVTAPVVYANYGTKADFETLQQLGVNVAGTIVLARYGGNFRGYKAKFAEEAGAAGLVIYTDPADSGYCKGITYPEGGYANDTCIQRGSINTLPYAGDALTPFVPATRDAERLDPAQVDLPTIPVQPVGWAAAREIMQRMTGPGVPQGWQGGLPFAYRVTGGETLTVRLKVEQEREIRRTVNVLGTLRGARFPEQKVIMGSHHDAWGFGASDPMAGTICVLESARSFTEAAEAGRRPARSIVFAAWAAEEYGIIGSTEWVEANRDDLMKNAVAYINLDMAAMGPQFGASASPSLKRLIAVAARSVPQARGKDGETVFDEWFARSPEPPGRWFGGGGGGRPEPRIGDMGGGSDHVAFLCHAGVPCMGLGGGGSAGTSYHSTYDNLAWYWRVVGEDYEPALMVTRMTNVIAVRLANAPLLPLDPARPGRDFFEILADLSDRGVARGVLHRQPRESAPESAHRGTDGGNVLAVEFEGFVEGAGFTGVGFPQILGDLLRAVEEERLSETALARINTALMSLDRAWLSPVGLPGRPWYWNLYAAPDEDSGYAAWMLPALRWAVEKGDEADITAASDRYGAVFMRISERLQEIWAALE